jgi:hypothetical protein
MKGNEKLTKERFCRVYRRDKKPQYESKEKAHKKMEKRKTTNRKERRKERANVREELGSMPMHLPL